MDPPDHTRMRKLLNHGFTSTAIADFRPKFEIIIERMIDQLVEKGRDGTKINSFSYHLPATIIAVMFGGARIGCRTVPRLVGSSRSLRRKCDRHTGQSRSRGAERPGFD